MKIQVRINEEGALRNQRHAFSNRFTLITELLQNARRAGAMLIEIYYDAQDKILTVLDDGQGLDDFQKLLSFHESGWDASVSAKEHPFGIGFSKCLYAARRCVVTSGRQRVDIDSAAALAQAVIEVEPLGDSDAIAGTKVELHGVDLPDLAQYIEELCAGFAVPVWFNGRPLERRLAEEHLTTQRTAIGKVYLAGVQEGKFTHDTWVFLQGFCVIRPIWSISADVNVVHLESSEFIARLPDRDQLIDEDVQRKRIDAVMRECRHRTLKDARTRMPPDRFLELYYATMREWGHLDLLNDLDVLPPSLCKVIAGYPIQEPGASQLFLQPAAVTPTRLDVLLGVVQLVAIDEVDCNSSPRWMLAREKGWLVFDWMGVHEKHWALPHVRFLDEEKVDVAPVVERVRTALEGRWARPNVILSEAVQIRMGTDEVLIKDVGVCHDRTLYIPDGEATGDPLLQLCSFTNDTGNTDEVQEVDRDTECEALSELIGRIRAVDPVQTLDSLLQSLKIGKYPVLHGKTFQVSVGVGSAPGHSVGLVESAESSPTSTEVDTGDPDARP